jgi:hypothetical protein
MRGVANEDDPAMMPQLDIDPFDRPDMELLIVFQGSEVLWDWPAEIGEAASESFEAAGERVLEPFQVNGSEAVCAALSHWDQSEEAPVAHENHHVVENSMRARRNDASPHHLPSVTGWRGTYSERAHGRMDAVGSHHKVVGFGRAVTKADPDVVIILRQGCKRDAKSMRNRGSSSQKDFV